MLYRRSSYFFESIQKPEHPGGAILALPAGFTKRTILSGVLYDIKLHLQEHVDSWYAPTNHWNSGNNLEDGALKLIISTYKSTIWGAGVLLRENYHPAIPIVTMEPIPSGNMYRWNTAKTPIRITHGSTKPNTPQIPYTVAIEVLSVHRNDDRPKNKLLNFMSNKTTASNKPSRSARVTESFIASLSRVSLRPMHWRRESRPGWCYNKKFGLDFFIHWTWFDCREQLWSNTHLHHLRCFVLV